MMTINGRDITWQHVAMALGTILMGVGIPLVAFNWRNLEVKVAEAETADKTQDLDIESLKYRMRIAEQGLAANIAADSARSMDAREQRNRMEQNQLRILKALGVKP